MPPRWSALQNRANRTFRYVVSGRESLEFYLSEPLELSRDEALERMQGWILSEDGETTCLTALVSTAGANDRRAAVAFARQAAEEVEGLEPSAIRMAGPTIEGVAIDDASQQGLLQLNGYSFAICFGILAICLKHFRAALLVFSLALFNEQLSLALIHWLGTDLDSILLLAVNLTFVLSISVGVHLVNYYRDALNETEEQEAPGEALRVALWPTCIATATTGLGLVSLGISDVVPLSRFGLYAALSVLVGSAIVMLYVPIHFRIWPARSGVRKPQAAEVESGAGELRPNSWWLGTLQKLALPLLLVVVVVLSFGGLGVRQLETAVGMRELVSPKMRSWQDFTWIEEHVTPLVPVELVVELPTGDARALLDQFRFVHRLHQSLGELDPAFAVVSSATFSPEAPPEGGGFRQRVQAAAFRQQLLQSQEELSYMGYLRSDETHNFWRLTLRVPSMQDINYGGLLERAQEVVDRTIAESNSAAPSRVLVCGSIPLIYNVQQKLLDDLIQSFLLAFSLVALSLTLLFRSVLCGLVCMIPNVLPSAIVFGFMGWMGWSVEVGTVLTASAALGIAVDDSLHFITWFQRALRAGRSVAESVASAYRRCGAAMIQTTLVCGLGLVVFGASGFSPIARFGWCMCILLFLALVADLVVLPAILLSPLGRLFVPREQAEHREAEGSEVNERLRKASLLAIVVGVVLQVSPGFAQTAAEQRDQLAALLPEQVLSAVCVSDFSLAVVRHAELTAGNAETAGSDFQQQFGVDPQQLAAVARGPLLRASVLEKGESQEVVLCRVSGAGMPPSLQAYVDSGVFISATSQSLAQAVAMLVTANGESDRSGLWHQLAPADAASKTNETSMWWYADAFLKDRMATEQGDDKAAAKRFKNAERHGLTAIGALVGTLAVEGTQINRAETLVLAARPWKQTLGMFEHLRPMDVAELESWLPGDVASVTVLSVDLPRAFQHIDALFDDGFADGIEGTYRDLLADIKLGIEVDLPADLFADFGTKAYVVRGNPEGQRPAGFMVGIETKAPDRAAEIIAKLMEDDPEAEPTQVGSHPYPMFLAAAKDERGEDFVMMVAHGHVFYTNDEGLMRQVLEPEQHAPLHENQALQQTVAKILAKSAERPSMLVVSAAPRNHSEGNDASSGSPFAPLFGVSKDSQADKDENPLSRFFGSLLPASAQLRVTSGYLEEKGLRFYAEPMTTVEQ